MRKILIGGVVFVLAAAALRRLRPALGRRVIRKCQEMFDRMPEEFPPKRMMRSVEEIREQNQRILGHLEDERTTLAAVSEGR